MKQVTTQMKVLSIFILILFNTPVATAQLKLNGTIGPIASVGYHRYTHASWEITYKFEKRNNDIYLIYYNPRITIPAHASYATPEKVYSKSDLGISAWPQSNPPPSSLNVEVNLLTPFGKTEPSGFAIVSASSGSSEDWVCSAKINGKEVDLSAFKLTIVKAFYNTKPVLELDNIIRQRKGQNMASGSTGALSTSAQNPLSTSSNTTDRNTEADTRQRSYEQSQAVKAARAEQTAQVVTQAASLAGGLLNEWNAASERKAQRRETENNAKWDRIHERAEDRFEFYYKKLIDLANNGDEDAQMSLYLESDNRSANKVPLRKNWFKKALENKNPTAVLAEINSTSGNPSVYDSNKEVLHGLADSGNIDAMVMLGMWYSQKKNKTNYFFRHQIYGTSHGHLKGGENEELAMKYLTMAAEKGSPNAMYYLAMIYLYGQTISDSYFIKFKVEKNEKLAFEWVQKSIIPYYRESTYRAHHITHLYWEGSYFEPASYAVLANFYEKGKILPKDLVKAAELRELCREREEYEMNARGQTEKL